MSGMPNTPIPSEPKDWTARESGPRRSIFGNYAARTGDTAVPEVADVASQALSSIGSSTADVAVARAFVHRYLASAFAYPSPTAWDDFAGVGQLDALRSAIAQLSHPEMALVLAVLREGLGGVDAGSFHDHYVATFGHAARGPVPINEIEFGEPRADALFQPHRLADLAAFYRAYGLEVGDSSERHDHLCCELEFMSVLAAKEAWAMSGLADGEALATCRETQRDFLREHLGRWTPAFARVLQTHLGEGPLVHLGQLLRVFVESECVRFGVPAGAASLVVRPVDEEGERLCEGCGLKQAPPGALAES